MTKQSMGRVGVALSPPDPWRKCWRCGVEYMGLSACPDCNTENAADAPAVGVAPSLAPLPDMTTCAYCGYLAVGYWRDGGMFVCSECWAHQEEQRAHCPEIEQEEPAPDGLRDALYRYAVLRSTSN